MINEVFVSICDTGFVIAIQSEYSEKNQNK